MSIPAYIFDNFPGAGSNSNDKYATPLFFDAKWSHMLTAATLSSPICGQKITATFEDNTVIATVIDRAGGDELIFTVSLNPH